VNQPPAETSYTVLHITQEKSFDLGSVNGGFGGTLTHRQK
jgi:hypothetical protein